MDPRLDRSRTALKEAAIVLLTQNTGASLSEIASVAKVGRATLYRHFQSREQLIRELALESLQMTDEVLEPIRREKLDARERLAKGLIAVMAIADRFHFLLVCSSWSDSDPEIERIYQRQLDELTALVEVGKHQGSISKDLSTEMIVGLIDSLVYAGWWAVSTGVLDSRAAGEQASQMLFNGISTKQ